MPLGLPLRQPLFTPSCVWQLQEPVLVAFAVRRPFFCNARTVHWSRELSI